MPGVGTGAAWEMISVRPSSVNSIPSVVTNEEMPTTATKKPLIEADLPLTSSDRITAGTSGTPAGRELVEDERREQVDGADREVDLAVDHHEHLARAEDRERREVRQQRLEVRHRREVRGVRREVHDRHDRDDDDAALAQRQEAADELRRTLARGSGSRWPDPRVELAPELRSRTRPPRLQPRRRRQSWRCPRSGSSCCCTA